jgi:hypothetical protein
MSRISNIGGGSSASSAPDDGTYIVQTASDNLDNEQVLADLATGIVKNTTATGVLSIATEGSDYYKPGGTDVAVTDGGTGASDAGTARTNLGLGSIATQNSNNVTITGGSVTGITDLAVADGGTGSSTAANARTALGLGTIATQDSNNVTVTGGSITGITDLAVADGGTGASTAGDARTNLGLGTIATQNANNVTITGGSVTGITDLVVADGGTGASTFTDGGVLVGNAAGVIQVTAVGTSGHVLTSNGAGSDPTFQAVAAGSVATDAIFDAKGDLAVGTGANTAQKLTVGSNDTVPIAASGETTGIKWANGAKNMSARVSNSTTITVATVTWTRLTWDTETFDNGGLHEGVTNPGRMTIPASEGGIYVVGANVQCEFGAWAMGLAIYKNGSAYTSNMYAFSAGSGRLSICSVLSLAATDYVEVFGYQDSGSNREFGYNSVGSSEFYIAKIL